ncbi:MAG TPA: sulfotransferase domain-containing protein [Rhizomicrobium sp.]|nr:sulfotransferase domain-containing protein [Rhizomicrobium sp.]
MSRLREFLSTKSRKFLFESRRLSPGPRAMPDFIVIGAQKSGTSSMFVYLMQHPQVVRPIFKEPYFFDRHYHRGLDWYGRNFPSRGAMDRLNDRHGRRHMTFEATATYVFDPDVPARIAADIPTRKFIALLRNPAERAISAYWHARRMGKEPRSLMEALDTDLKRYEQEKAFEAGTGPKPQGEPPRPTYLRRGIYAESIARWQSVFSPADLLVLQSEAMFANPKSTMARVFAFLGLPHAEGIDYAAQNVGGYGGTDPEARRFLEDFYRPHNEWLNRISRTALSW